MIVPQRDELQTPAQQVLSQNNHLKILLACYRRGEVSLADLKISAANIAGDLPFYRGIQSDESGFNDTLKNLERNFSFLQKEIVFSNLRKGAVGIAALAALCVCIVIWQTTTV